MDNINSITESIQSPSSSITESSSYGGFLEGLKQVDLTTWLIIFLIFTFLGFNIFVYLAKGTDYLAKISENISNAIKPITDAVVSLFGEVTGDVVDVAVSGTQKIITTSATEINKGLDSIQNGEPLAPNGTSSSIKGQDFTNTPAPHAIALNSALDSASKQQGLPAYQADESNSKIQTGGAKSGWCYIGEDRGFRTCAQVGVNDTCMSGDIFPSQEICVNPNLRA